MTVAGFVKGSAEVGAKTTSVCSILPQVPDDIRQGEDG
jgi:hypothetical protein